MAGEGKVGHMRHRIAMMRWIIKRFTKPPAIDFELSYTVEACPERRQAPKAATLSATISDYVQ